MLETPGTKKHFRYKAASIYGANIPSPIPRPSNQKPAASTQQTPAPFPWEKRIPINTRDIERELNDHLEAAEPTLVRFLYSTWNAQTEDIKYQEISNAIRDKQIPSEWVDNWSKSYAKMVQGPIRSAMKDSIKVGGDYMANRISETTGVVWDFPDEARRIRDWVDNRTGELITALPKSQIGAIRTVLDLSLVDQGLSTQETAKLIRPLIGLTKRDAVAVAKRRMELLKNKVPVDKAERSVQDYAGFLKRRRADLIARTETASAFNFGAQAGMLEAVSDGTFLENEIAKIFKTSGDEAVCPFCGPLNNTVVGIKSTFPGLTNDLPNVYVPPVHPGCRCTVDYEIIDSKDRKAFPLPKGLDRVTSANKNEYKSSIIGSERKAGARSAIEEVLDSSNAFRAVVATTNSGNGVLGAMSTVPRNTEGFYEIAQIGSMKRGTGTKLVDYAMRDAFSHNLGLEAKANEASREFFSRMGMTQQNGVFRMSQSDIQEWMRSQRQPSYEKVRSGYSARIPEGILDKVKRVSDGAVAKIAKERGLSEEEVIRRLENRMKDMLEGGSRRMFHETALSNVRPIGQFGRFRNFYELLRGHAPFKQRNFAEANMLGVPPATHLAARPIYAAIPLPGFPSSPFLKSAQKASFIFRPEVSRNATFIMGDSVTLSKGRDIRALASPIANPSYLSVPTEMMSPILDYEVNVNTLKDLGSSFDYVEGHIPGPVTLDKVLYLDVDKDLERPLIQLFEDQGVQVRIRS